MENKQETEPVTQTEPVKDKIEGAVTQTDDKNEKKSDAKTFTQEEVNAMVLKAENKINKKYEKVDLEAYNKWQESQKTEAQKQSEFNQKLTDTTNENIALKQENLVLKSGVNSEDADYVVYKVTKMEGEFEDNLKDFLKDNPKFLQKEEEKSSPENSGIPINRANENKESAVASILKKKHPELFK